MVVVVEVFVRVPEDLNLNEDDGWFFEVFAEMVGFVPGDLNG